MKLLAIAALIGTLAASGLSAQRISTIPEGDRSQALGGQIPPATGKSADRGAIDPTRPIHYISLVFNKTPEQQSDLDRLLIAQQNPQSPDFHHWLTPAEYADRFGLDPVSMARVQDWLQGQGFSIDAESVSRTWIAFSGIAAQVDNSFHTALHVYDLNGKAHFAPTRDPSVPETVRPAILAIRGLNDFTGEHVRMRPQESTAPAYSAGNGKNNLTPDDLAAIYDIAPLYAAGFDGTGQSIAIVGESGVNLDDISAYRARFGLPAKVPSLIAVAEPAIPPYTAAQSEASLDLELSGAIARGADQFYVYATNVEDAVSYAIDTSLAPVLSMSFHTCERSFSSSDTAFWAAKGQEAASKGITWLVSSGDSGPADCDAHEDTGQVAQDGISVNAFAAIPEVTAVAGTEFNDAASESTAPYWNSANGPGLGSAGGYIPETVWNDSATAGYLAASGGGSSVLFPKPAWQIGPGVPNDGARDVPDVALTASWVHDGFFICTGGDCTLSHGGTSAAAPVFAGMVVLLNQYLVKQGLLNPPPSFLPPHRPLAPNSRLGNINPMLYRLAQAPKSPFHDILTGSNVVPCSVGSPDCTTGSFGFPAAKGYDLATGLGSVDATLLCNSWVAALKSTLAATVTTVVASPQAISQTFSVTVTSSGSAGPSGTITLTAGAMTLGSAALSPGATSSTAAFTVYNAQLPFGASTVVAFYSGGAGYLPSSGATSILIASSSSTKSSVKVFVSPNPVLETPTAYGKSWNFTLTLREVNGAPADLTRFMVNGVDATSAISSWFGSATLPAFGSVSVPLQLNFPKPNTTPPFMTLSALTAYGSGTGIASPATPLATVLVNPLAVPAALNFEIDIPGATNASAYVASIFSASLLGRPHAASLQLTGAPQAVLYNPAAPANCRWSQQLLLRELSGTGVTLNVFKAGGTDMSSSIGSLWGATRVEGNGALSAPMCWSGFTAPLLINYEIDGTDDNGNVVSAAMTSPFLNQPSTPNTLTVTAPNLPPTGPLNLNNSGGPVVFNVTTSSSVQVWRVSVFAPGLSPAWLSVNPASGANSGSVYVTPVSGLLSGTYNANLLFQSADAQPQVVSVPVIFTVP